MPWQRMVADVALEVVRNESGVWIPAYREIVITVPRQNGKTMLLLMFELDRCLMWGKRQLVIYSAQTGNDAREQMLNEQAPLLHGEPEGSGPFSPVIRKIDKTNGREAIVFKGGSRIAVVANTASSGHGKTVGLAVVDEAFNDVDDRREGALLPAMSTIEDGQLIVASTQGTDESLYFNRKVETGRDLSLRESDVAYFEWSAPDNVDIDDPAVWAACMPAWGITVKDRPIRHARATMTEGEFRRAFLNQRTASNERVIPENVWSAACSDQISPENGLMLGVDCNPERSSASVAVADNEGRIELVEHRAGTGWLVTRTAELARTHKAGVAVDPSGPAGSFISGLQTANCRVVEVGGRQMVDACGQFYDGITTGTVRLRTDNRLDSAAAAAKKRPSGDAWTWARKTSMTDISPLVAATVAVFAARNGPHHAPFAVYA